MKLFVSIIACGMMLLASTNLGQTQESNSLTLQQCLDMALQRNPAVKSAREDIRASIYGRQAAYSEFLPKLEAGYSYGYNRNVPAFVINGTEVPVGSRDQYSAFVGLRQPLFKGGSTYYTYQLAKIGVDTSKVNFIRQKVDLILDVKTTYYNILRTERNRVEAERAVKRLTAHLNDAKNFFEVGLIAKNDVLQSEVQLAQARQDLVRAEQAWKLATSQLNVLLERDMDETLTLAETLEYKPYPISFHQGLKNAYEQRPEISAAKLAIAKSEKSIELAKSPYYPNVNLSIKYEKDSDTASLERNPYGLNENVTALTSLTWTFWEWGKTRNLVEESKSRQNQAIYALTQVTDSVRLEVKQAFLDLEEAEKNIGTAKVAIEQAEENFRLNQERYNVQVATSTDVLDAQTLLTRANTNYFNALAQYNIAMARVERAIGEPAKSDGSNVR